MGNNSVKSNAASITKLLFYFNFSDLNILLQNMINNSTNPDGSTYCKHVKDGLSYRF